MEGQTCSSAAGVIRHIQYRIVTSGTNWISVHILVHFGMILEILDFLGSCDLGEVLVKSVAQVKCDLSLKAGRY